MKPIETEPPTYWQQIFELAHCNSREYQGDKLPTYKWDWPKNGFLTRRMAEVKAREARDAKAQTV